MFELRMFTARDGDAILLSYEGPAGRRHVLVDGGRRETYTVLRPALARIADAGERIELLVLTHIDADHIEGLLELIQDPDRPITIDEVWFNGPDQLSRLQALGFDQGDAFQVGLKAAALGANARFQGGPIVLPANGCPPRFVLDGGLAITLLSPDTGRLTKLAAQWRAWHAAAPKRAMEKEARRGKRLQAMGRRPMPARIDVAALAEASIELDRELVNGTSIAFVAEWAGARALLAADAHPDLLCASLDHLREPGKSYVVDLLKVPHHGSAGNITAALLERLECRRYAISTDGSRHGHPDPEAVARLLRYGTAGRKELWFNYRQASTTPWAERSLCESWDYVCFLPEDQQGPTIVPVAAT